MRRYIVAMLAIAGLAVPVVAGAAAKKHIHFTSTTLGAQYSNTQAAYKIHDSFFGNGAGVQTIKVNSKATGGTDSETTYYGNASLKSKGTFTLSAPDAHGVYKIKGSGRDISGTGKAKGITSTYTFTGTFDSKTFVVKATLKGTYNY